MSAFEALAIATKPDLVTAARFAGKVSATAGAILAASKGAPVDTEVTKDRFLVLGPAGDLSIAPTATPQLSLSRRLGVHGYREVLRSKCLRRAEALLGGCERAFDFKEKPLCGKGPIRVS